MQGDDSSNEDSLSMPADATIPLENHDDDTFAAERQDLKLRLEQLELEQRSLRIQLRQRHQQHRSRPPVPPLHPNGPRPRKTLTDDATTCICVHPRLYRAAPPPRDHRNTTPHTRHSHDERRGLILVPHKQGTA